MTGEPATFSDAHAWMPPIGLGTWPLRGEEATRAVVSGIENGYRLIDTAAKYENEDAVGSGIRAAGVPRERVFVTTKLRGADMAAGATRAALERSLAALGLDYIDLYLIHWPLPWLGRFSQAFTAMAELATQGRIRAIGVSNFQAAHVARLVSETGLTPAVDQFECDPTIQRRALRRDLGSRRIIAQSWSPLGRGGPLLRNPIIVRSARSLGCTPSQLILRWHRAHGIVPIVKSASPDRQRENLAAVRLAPLPASALADLDGLDADDQGERRIRDSDVYEEL
jgi:diketogulonate reductase-like aldo/keto reductase